MVNKKRIKWVIFKFNDGSFKGYNLNAFKLVMNEHLKDLLFNYNLVNNKINNCLKDICKDLDINYF